jgi:toxin FitB
VSFLLDTNVVSEWVKPGPDPNVVAWLADVDEDRVFLSVVTFAEIRREIELMPAGRRRERLAAWLADELAARFEGRILGIDQRIAAAWGIVMARSHKVGVGLGSMDAFLAATAEAHRLTLVTRNVRDFETTGISVLDPWEPRP